jgi:CHAT domain-containing protein
LLAFLLAFLSACKVSRQAGPVEEFRQAQLDFLRGDLIRARSEAHRARSIFSGSNGDWDWKFRLLEAEILVNQGLSEQALSLLASPLPAPLAEGDLAIKKATVQGIAFARRDRLDDADRSLKEADHLSALRGSDLRGEVARAQGVVAVIRGDLANAERFFRASLQIAHQQEDHFLELTALLNLGVVAMKEEHHDESLEWSNRAYRVAKSVGAHLTEEKALGNLGLEYYYMGDFERSLAMSIEATRQAHELDAEYDEVQWLNQSGLVHYHTNELSVAEDYYRKSLSLAQKIQNREEIVGALSTLALVSVKQDHLDEAEQFSQQAIKAAQGDHSIVIPPLLVRGLVAARREEKQKAEQVFQSVAHDPQSDSSEHWEAEESLALLYENEHRLADADRQYRKALQIFEAARSSLHHEDFELPFMANGTQLYDDYIHFLLEQGKTSEALQTAEYSRAQTLAEGLGLLEKRSTRSPATFNPRQIARGAGGTVLFYWLGPKQACLWTVTQDNVRLFQLPPVSEIDAAVQSYRKALVASRDVLQTANPEGRKLYDILVAPAKQAIAPNSRVVIIPDGSLNNLNFETLLVPEPTLHYWIEDVTIINASSLRLLAAAHSSSKTKAGKLLLIGDAVASDPEYAELPEAALEITDIEKHFAPAERQVYTRLEATAPAYLRSAPEQFSYIHFVAHGTASRLSPLDSAVILSKASAEEDSFKLYARDIIQLPLHAELVTISTCYGAGARAYTGEGLVGLSWAFLRAGAHNVIGALWEVSDTSTPRLMDQLYSELKRGRSPEAALRSAKLSLLHSDGIFRKPFYWAAFQLYTGT